MVVDVIDYGAGNLASVVKALRVVGTEPRVATSPETIAASRAILIPGVGHFAATGALTTVWRDAITTRLNAGAALLGICLGMQWLFEGSEEAPTLDGLGLFTGRCRRLDGTLVKIPHVGWNALDRTSSESRLLAAVPDHAYAYFTHTYAAPVGPECVATTTHSVPFASVVERGRVFGAQWHPEKSSDTGLAVLRAFVAIAGGSR